MPGHIDLDRQTIDLETLLARVGRGEEIVLSRDGRPVMRVAPAEAATASVGELPFGVWRDKLWLAEDAAAPLPDGILDDFERWPKDGQVL